MKHMKGTVAIAGMAASLLFAGVAGADAFHTDLVTDGRTVVAAPADGGAGGATQGDNGGAGQSGPSGGATDPSTTSPDGKAGTAPECKCDQKGAPKTEGAPGLPGGLPSLPGAGGLPGLPGSGG